MYSRQNDTHCWDHHTIIIQRNDDQVSRTYDLNNTICLLPVSCFEVKENFCDSAQHKTNTDFVCDYIERADAIELAMAGSQNNRRRRFPRLSSA